MMKHIILSALLIVALLLGNMGMSTASAATTPQKIVYASSVVTQVNQQRAKAHLKPLKVSEGLCVMANDKAIDMYWNHYFSHTSPYFGSPFNMMKNYGIHYSYAGENIAMGQRTPTEVMTAWMNSPGHKANILNPHYTTIGVAYYKGEWVQEFIG